MYPLVYLCIMQTQTVTLAGEELILHPLKAIYWPREKAFLIADFHLGKGAHFRRNGIMVHSAIDMVNLKNLNILLKSFPVEKVLFLGDLFHSRYNQEWLSFEKYIKQQPGIAFHLVMGNHDILPESIYTASNLIVHKEFYQMDPFYFSHKPLEEFPKGLFNLAGHIHPGVMLKGGAKQYMRLPCFYFSENQGIMPAFGEFTGLSMLKPKKKDKVFVSVDKSVICL